MKLNKYYIVAMAIALGIVVVSPNKPHPVTQIDLITLSAILLFILGASIEDK